MVEAIASGKKAAFSIERFLRGDNLRAGSEEAVAAVEKLPKETIEKRPRREGRMLSAEERKGSFGEIKGTLEREAAEEELRRCNACGNKAFIRYPDDCMTCYTCEKDCLREAIRVSSGHVSSPVSCWG